MIPAAGFTNYYAGSSPVNYTGNSVAANHLASFAVSNVSGALNISAVRYFNGAYSGVPVSDIRASETIVV